MTAEPTITFLDLARAIGADPAHERTIQGNLKLLYSDALSGALSPNSLSWNAHSHCNRRDSEGYLLEAVQPDGRLDFAPKRAHLTPRKIIEILADDFRWPLADRGRDLLALGKDDDARRLVAEGPVPDEARARLFVESLATTLSEACRFCKRNNLPVPGVLSISPSIGGTMIGLPERAWLSLSQAIELVSSLTGASATKALEAIVGAGIDGRIISQGIGTYGSIVDPRLHQLGPHEWRADASRWRENEIGENRKIEIERRSIYAWLGVPMPATDVQSADASDSTKGYLPAWLPPERALDLVMDLQRGPGPSDVVQLVFELSSAVLDGVVRARRDGKVLSAEEVKWLAQGARRWRGRLPEGIELCAEDIRRVWTVPAPAATGLVITVPSGGISGHDMVDAIVRRLYGDGWTAPVQYEMNDLGEVRLRVQRSSAETTPDEYSQRQLEHYQAAVRRLREAFRRGELSALVKGDRQVAAIYWQLGAADSSIVSGHVRLNDAAEPFWVPRTPFDAWLRQLQPVAEQATISPAPEATVESAARSTSPRRPRKRDAFAAATLKNRIEGVLAATTALRRSEAGKGLSPEDLAEELVSLGKGQDFKAGTLRQIIRGTYRPMKTLSIKGLN